MTGVLTKALDIIYDIVKVLFFNKKELVIEEDYSSETKSFLILEKERRAIQEVIGISEPYIQKEVIKVIEYNHIGNRRYFTFFNSFLALDAQKKIFIDESALKKARVDMFFIIGIFLGITFGSYFSFMNNELFIAVLLLICSIIWLFVLLKAALTPTKEMRKKASKYIDNYYRSKCKCGYGHSNG